MYILSTAWSQIHFHRHLPKKQFPKVIKEEIIEIEREKAYRAGCLHWFQLQVSKHILNLG